MNEPDRDRSVRNRALYALILLAIAMSAGPEYFAALELTALLELLGATLFLFAYGAGARLILLQLLSAALAVLVPAPQRVLLSARIPAAGKAGVLAYVCLNAFSVIALTAVFCAFLRTLPGLLM